MKEALVFIGFGEIARKVRPFSPYSLLIEGGAQTFSEEELERELLTFYQDFKVTGAERVRYITLFPPYEGFGLSVQHVFKVIADLHREVILLPFETEAFILLPSVKSDRTAKARGYRFFENLETIPPRSVPELLWLLDPDRLPDDLVDDILSLYLSTNVYRSFNAQAETKANRAKGRRYSSLGVAKLVFPAQKWHEYLSLMLVRDLLGVRPLSPVSVSLETARMALSQILPFLTSKLSKISEAVSRPATFPQSEILLEGLAIDEEERLEKFLARLKLHINQKKAKCWDEMNSDAELFCQEAKKELESILDEAPHGLYSAWGFMGLILASGGPYLEFLKELDPWPEGLSGVSLQSFLFGWQERIPSPVLDLLFREVMKELRQFYVSWLLPFPEPATWEAIFQELCRLLEVPELEKIIGEGRNFIEALKEKTEIVVMAAERPYASPLSGEDLEGILELLEARAREYLQGVINEVSPVRKEFEELEQRIAALGWKKYLPWFWPLLFRKRAKKAEFERAKARLRQAYLQVLERRQRLFPCYFAPFVAERLSELLETLEEEIKAFISLLGENRSSADQRIDGMDFSLPPFGFQVVKTEEDIKSLYYHKFGPQDIPRLFDKFIQSFKEPGEPPPKVSDFYTPAEKRTAFIRGLCAYSLASFAWVKDWDVRKVIAHLKKGNEMGSLLERRAETFLQFKDPVPTDIETALFVGLDNESRSPFPSSAFSAPSPLFYSHGKPEIITGLRLCHGFPASSMEGWEHWRTCAQREEGQE